MWPLPLLLPNSTWPCESHSPLRSQLKCLFFKGPLPDSLRLSEVPIHGLPTPCNMEKKILCNLMCNEIRNHVYFLYHYIRSTKTAYRDETLTDGGFSTGALSSPCLVFWSWICYLLFNLFLTQFPHLKSGDSNGVMSKSVS